MKIIVVLMLLIPVASWAQRVRDSALIFECTYREQVDQKPFPARELCYSLLEEKTTDRGTLLVRTEVLKLLDAGYFPVADVTMKTVGPYMGTSTRQIEGRFEFSKDFKDRPESEIIVVTFAGLLVWNPDGGWFTLDKPKRYRSTVGQPRINSR